MSTGTNASQTGARVGRVLKKYYDKASDEKGVNTAKKKFNQANRIGSKISFKYSPHLKDVAGDSYNRGVAKQFNRNKDTKKYKYDKGPFKV